MTRMQKLSPLLLAALLVACTQSSPMAPNPVLPEVHAVVVQAGQGTHSAKLNVQLQAPYSLQQVGTVHRWVPGDVMHYEVELKQRNASNPNQYDAMGAGLSTQVLINTYGAGSVSFTQLEAGRCYRAYVRAMGRVGGAGGSGNVVQLNTQAQNDHVDFDFTASNDIRSEISRSVTVQLDNTPFSGTGQLAFASPVPGSFLVPSASPALEILPHLQGEFSLHGSLASLSIDPSGKLWVGYNDNGLLSHFDSNGSLLGNHDLGFANRGIQAMPDGSVWTGDFGSIMVHLASDGSSLPGFNAGVSSIQAIASDSQGKLWVLGNTLKKFHADGSVVAEVNVFGIMESRLHVTPSDRVWLSDINVHVSSIKLFDSNGNELAQHEFSFEPYLASAAMDAQGHMWCMIVNTTNNAFLRHHDADGQVVGGDLPLPFTLQWGSTCSMAVDEEGKFWMGTQDKNQVLRFNRSGQVLASFNIPAPSQVKVGPNRTVWVASQMHNKIHLIR